MKPGLHKDDATNVFMDVNIVVQGQNFTQAQIAQGRNGVAQNHDQNHHGIEKQASTIGSREHVKRVGLGAIQVGKVFEVDRSRDKQNKVDRLWIRDLPP